MLWRLADILIEQEILFPPTTYHLPVSIIYTNEADFDPKWTAQVLATAYAGRTGRCDAIVLGRLPRQTVLFGGHHCLLRFDGRVTEESLPHAMRLNPKLIEQELSKPIRSVELKEECVLLARYGYGTWGHWLAEIVPMAAVVEHRYPGRYRYAIPYHPKSAYRELALECLAAYGIGVERLIPLVPGVPRVLTNCLIVTPVRSDKCTHPAVLDVMRGAVRLSAYKAGYEKIALMRRDVTTRAIANSEEVEGYLRAKGFTITDAGTMCFADQVRMFQSAQTVFGVIGSGLTGLIYSPDGVRVLATGPAMWGDRFFYALAQQRRGMWSEVRGPSMWNGEGLKRDAPFTVPLEALRDGLTKLEAIGCGS